MGAGTGVLPAPAASSLPPPDVAPGPLQSQNGSRAARGSTGTGANVSADVAWAFMRAREVAPACHTYVYTSTSITSHCFASHGIDTRMHACTDE